MKKYFLHNLDCAGCAAKIESNLKKQNFVRSVSIDFSSASMLIDTDLIDQVEKEIKSIDPGIKVDSYTKIKNDSVEIEKTFNPGKELWITSICLIIYIVALIFNHKLKQTPYELGSWLIFITVYAISGWKVIVKALMNIKKGGFFDENFLMTIATLGAFAINALSEAAGVMIFFKIGEYLQELSIHRSRRSIKALLEIRPDYANLLHGTQVVRVSPEEVSVNDEIIVKPGEKIPLDGIVLEGSSQLDTSALTGESVPRSIKKSETVLAGMINKSGLLKIKVTKPFTESSITKILELVENATHKKAKTEMFFTTFAKYYTPAIVGIALITAILPPLLSSANSFSDWIYRALVILVISCPCALVVSIPLTYFGGIGRASKRGILIKGSSFLDSLNNVKTVVFDKTGTLSKGIFKVTKIKVFNSYTEEELLKYTAEAEIHSNHPIALSIIEAYGKTINTHNIKNYSEIGGHGVSAEINNKQILAGNARLMEEFNISFTECQDAGTIVYVAVDKMFAGFIIINDELKEDSEQAIKNLKKQGINNLFMLTGDNQKIAEDIAMKLNLNEFYANLLPEDKVEKLEEFISRKNKNEKLIFVGDGINDAPVLALSDIGISMGNIGSDAAIETADVIIMNDSLTKIPEVISIAQKTRKIIIQNIVFALGVKILFVFLGFLGIASMWEAVFADVGVTLIAVFNASRILNDF